MDVTLHKRCAKFVYVIPEGLRELMSDISREVIRSQPEQMYTFIADYLDALMITRENARVAARLVDSIIRIASMTVELLTQTGMSREEADRMANIIQEAFKKYMALRPGPVVYSSPQEEEEEEQDMIVNIIQCYGDLYDQESSAVQIIQRAFREFKNRHARERQLLTGMIDWRIAARSAIYLYRKTGVTMEEANRAATLIKAAYKGYYTRRVLRRLLEEGRQIYEERGEDFGEMESSFLSLSKEETSEEDLSPTGVATKVLKGILAKVVPSEKEFPGIPSLAKAKELQQMKRAFAGIHEPSLPKEIAEWLKAKGWCYAIPGDLSVEKTPDKPVTAHEYSRVYEQTTEDGKTKVYDATTIDGQTTVHEATLDGDQVPFPASLTEFPPMPDVTTIHDYSRVYKQSTRDGKTTIHEETTINGKTNVEDRVIEDDPTVVADSPVDVPVEELREEPVLMDIEGAFAGIHEPLLPKEIADWVKDKGWQEPLPGELSIEQEPDEVITAHDYTRVYRQTTEDGKTKIYDATTIDGKTTVNEDVLDGDQVPFPATLTKFLSLPGMPPVDTTQPLPPIRDFTRIYKQTTSDGKTTIHVETTIDGKTVTEDQVIENDAINVEEEAAPLAADESQEPHKPVVHEYIRTYTKRIVGGKTQIREEITIDGETTVHEEVIQETQLAKPDTPTDAEAKLDQPPTTELKSEEEASEEATTDVSAAAEAELDEPPATELQFDEQADEEAMPEESITAAEAKPAEPAAAEPSAPAPAKSPSDTHQYTRTYKQATAGGKTTIREETTIDGETTVHEQVIDEKTDAKPAPEGHEYTTVYTRTAAEGKTTIREETTVDGKTTVREQTVDDDQLKAAQPAPAADAAPAPADTPAPAEAPAGAPAKGPPPGTHEYSTTYKRTTVDGKTKIREETTIDGVTTVHEQTVADDEPAPEEKELEVPIPFHEISMPEMPQVSLPDMPEMSQEEMADQSGPEGGKHYAKTVTQTTADGKTKIREETIVDGKTTVRVDTIYHDTKSKSEKAGGV